MKREITPADILAPAAYEAIRDEKRRAIMAMKKNRRMAVGPYAMFYFENYETMWLQVQEMLRIEKGGDAQLADELPAYNPMIPNGQELTATVMFEIEDAARRAVVLASLGGVESHIAIRVGDEIIKAKAETDLDYTSDEGKASSVQFLHFPFTASQISRFRSVDTEVLVTITHPSYAHMASIPPSVRAELQKDFA
jgi:hypothetical protein